MDRASAGFTSADGSGVLQPRLVTLFVQLGEFGIVNGLELFARQCVGALERDAVLADVGPAALQIGVAPGGLRRRVRLGRRRTCARSSAGFLRTHAHGCAGNHSGHDDANSDSKPGHFRAPPRSRRVYTRRQLSCLGVRPGRRRRSAGPGAAPTSWLFRDAVRR